MPTQQSLKKHTGDLRDQRLINWMKEDLTAGFNRVAEVYQKQLIAVAYGVLCGSHLVHLTEDIVQEGLISAYCDLANRSQEERLEKLSGLYLRAWLYTIIRRKALKCLMVGEQHLELSAGLLGEEIEEQNLVSHELTRYDDPEYLHERWESITEARRTVSHLLKRLSPDQRMIIKRKYLSQESIDPEKITYKQIAEEMNKPVGTIKSEASRAKEYMRKQLTAQGDSKNTQRLTKLA